MFRLPKDQVLGQISYMLFGIFQSTRGGMKWCTVNVSGVTIINLRIINVLATSLYFRTKYNQIN